LLALNQFPKGYTFIMGSDNKKKKEKRERKEKREKKEKKEKKDEPKPKKKTANRDGPVSKAEILAQKGIFKRKSDVKVKLFDAPKAVLPTEDAKLFGDVTDSDTKKSCKKLFKMLNLDPWNEVGRYDDDDTCDVLIDHPEPCEFKFEFEGFSGRIYPLSMLCALKASKDAVELAYEAFKPAIKESDLWVGTPFHFIAAYKAPAETVEYMISKDPRGVESTNYYGRTPLHMGALFKAPEDSMKLIAEKFPKAAQIKDKEGYTPLHLACENGASAGVIKLLLETFPKAVFAKSQYDMTPLHFACSQNADPAVIKVLLVDGDPDTCRMTDMLGHTPLHMALMGLAQYEVIELLVASAPDCVVAKTQKGEIPFEIAQRKRAPAEVMELLGKMIEKLYDASR
jgi:hypothetical protein